MDVEEIWLFEDFGQNHVKISIDPQQLTNGAIPMTGADVTKQLRIKFSHRINKLLFYHVDSSYDPSIDNLDVNIQRQVGTMHPLKMKDILVDDETVDPQPRYEGGDKYEYEPSIWLLTLKTTNTDLVIPVFYVQKIKGMK